MILPIKLEIKLPKDDFVYKVAEICDELDYQVLKEHRPKVLKALTSEEGALLRMNRSIQVEGVFGVLKEDYGFRRFITRGKTNIETQFFLLAFAFNIEKLCNRAKKGRTGLDLFKLNAS